MKAPLAQMMMIASLMKDLPRMTAELQWETLAEKSKHCLHFDLKSKFSFSLSCSKGYCSVFEDLRIEYFSW